MMEKDKAEAQLASRTRVWYEVIESRRWKVQQIYGLEAAKRYTYLNKEKQFFLLYGHLPSNPSKDSLYEAQALQKEIDAYHAEFWTFCDSQYPVQRDAYFSRIEQNKKNAASWPEYQKQQKDRDQLADYLKSQQGQSSSPSSTPCSLHGSEAPEPTTRAE